MRIQRFALLGCVSCASTSRLVGWLPSGVGSDVEPPAVDLCNTHEVKGEVIAGTGLDGPVLIPVAVAQALSDCTLFVPTLLSPLHDPVDLGQGLVLNRLVLLLPRCVPLGVHTPPSSAVDRARRTWVCVVQGTCLHCHSPLLLLRTTFP